MLARTLKRPGLPVAVYEAVVALAGWGALFWLSCTTGQVEGAGSALAFLLLALALKREGFRVAPLVTHSLAGVAVLSALLALGPLSGAWVAALTALLFGILHLRDVQRATAAARWRLALFGGGLSALVSLVCAALYGALGGRWLPSSLSWADLPSLLALSLTWFLGDHVGWSARITLEEGLPGLQRFLRSISLYSLIVELLPLPLAAVVALTYRVPGHLPYVLLAIFLLGLGEVLRRLSLTLSHARQRVADLTVLNAFSRALLASKLDVIALCRLLQTHTAAVVDARHLWLGLYDARRGQLEVALATGGRSAAMAGPPEPDVGLVEWMLVHRAPLLIRDAAREVLPFKPAGGAQPRFRSGLFVPLVAANNLIGLLAVQSLDREAYGGDDLRTVTTFANQAAMAIQNAHSYEAEQRRARQIATVGEVSRRVVAILGMEELFTGVVSLVREAFGYYDVQLFTVDPAGKLEFQASTSPLLRQRGLVVLQGQGLVGWVAQTGEQLLANDVAREPRYRLVDGLADTRSEVVVPLKIDERLVGILDVQSDRLDAFDEDDLFVLRTLADQIAIAIEDNRLYRAEKARRQLADTLREIAGALNSTLEPRAVLDLVLTQLRRVIRCDATAILEWRADHWCVVAGYGARYANPEICLNGGEIAELQRLVSRPAPIVFERIGEDGGEELVAHCLAAPLLVKERLIGALSLDRQGREGGYSEEEIGVVSAFANQAAVAIENARLYAAQQEEAWITTALLQVAETLANLIGIDEVLDAILHLVPILVGVDRCAIYLRNEDTGLFQAVRIYGLIGAAREAFLTQTLEGSMPAVWRALQGANSLELEAGEGEVGQEAQRVLGVMSGLALTLRVGGKVIGVLVAGHLQEADRQMHRDRRAILTGIANQAAMAIQNAHLYIAQREEAWVSTALLQVADLAGRTRDLNGILDGLARLTSMLVGVDRCCVFLWDRALRQYSSCQAYGLSEEQKEKLCSAVLGEGDFPLLDRVRSTAEPLAIEAATSLDLVPAELTASLGMSALLALPLRSQAEVLGIMLVDEVVPSHHFPARRVALLTGIANQAAVAIENVQLYRESLQRERMTQELNVARQIQATLLPEGNPSLPGWAIVATTRPAREVGGDFYDFIPLDSHHLGIVIADVSDKGVPAALFMALSRSVVRATARRRHSPAMTLRRVNDLLLADSRSGMFVTLFYGILDTRTGELTYGSAGHNPAYWRQSADGNLVRLQAHGIALGIVQEPTFVDGEIVLEPGDSLVLYTDGVTESFDAALREFGEDGLAAVIRATGTQPAEQLLAAINGAVQEFVGDAPQHDDYTLLVITRDA